MLDIDEIKDEIVSSLLPLEPDKIILFGSYAYGNPNEESDIDLFLLKDDLNLNEIREFELKARKQVRNLIFKYNIGFDILSAPTDYIKKREDYFYKIDILQNGRMLYEQNISK